MGLSIGAINILTYVYPVSAMKLVGDFKLLNTYNAIGGLVFMTTFIIIVVRVWKNKQLHKSEKGQWTFLIILLPIVLGTYYLWVKEKQMEKKVR